MIKYFIAVLFAVMSTFTFGAGVDISQLSESDRKWVMERVQAAQQSQQPKVIDTAERWVDVGARIGQGMAAAAGQVGVAVNEFAVTPVGVLTAVIIAWKLIGAQIVGIIMLAGIALFAITYSWWTTTNSRTRQTTYSRDKTDIFGRARVEEVHIYPIPDGNIGGGAAIALIGCLIATIGIVNII